ncbi:MAG: PKD domain-containing protein [Thermoplasmatota archaeon]
MNGTIPIVQVNEDDPAENVLDLKEYIWDPDGHGLEFSVVGPRSYEWYAMVENGVVSFDLNGDIGENWFGELIFSGHCRGPGKDGVWETEDDTDVFYFDVVLEVAPVNDAPSIDAIVVNGTRHIPDENGFVFHLEFGEPFMGEIEWTDIDGDDVLLELEEPSHGLTLFNGTLMLTTFDDVSLIATNLTIMDDNGSAVQRVHLTINIYVQTETSLTGISFDGKNVSIYREGDHINMTIFEREEWTIYFIFENGTQSSIIELDDPHDMISISGTTATVFGVEVTDEVALFTAELGWKGNREWDSYRTVYFHLTVLNVNRPPVGLGIDAEGPFYLNETVEFTVTAAVDPDGDPLAYTVDWGDGSRAEEWTPGEELTHVFTGKGQFIVHITVEDRWGAILTSTVSLDIQERSGPGPDDDDDVDDDDVKDERSGDLYFIIAIITILLVGILIGAILLLVRGRGDEDDEYYEEVEGDPLMATLSRSLEE